jgi:hypothetical protein
MMQHIEWKRKEFKQQNQYIARNNIKLHIAQSL